MEAETLYGLGLVLIFGGIIVILVAMALLFISKVKAGNKDKGKGKVEGGGAIIVGPFPIIFGTDKGSIKTVLVLSIILTVVTVIFYLLSS